MFDYHGNSFTKMSKNILTLSKWIPSEIKNYDNLFQNCIDLEKNAMNLIQRVIILLKQLRNCTKYFYSPIENEQQIQVRLLWDN